MMASVVGRGKVSQGRGRGRDRPHWRAMPELPEVEFGRKTLHAAAVGRTIAHAWVGDDDIVVDGTTANRMTEALVGAAVTGTDRHGKHLWMELDRRPWPLFHFGMTGGFRSPGDSPLRLDASPASTDRSWPPRFAKIVLGFDDGGQIAMTNARRLGRLRLRDDPRSEAPIARLGFDPLRTLPSPARFEALLKRRGKAKLKGLLLDQKFAAGVGNWIADEVLYQAGLAPLRTVGSLAPDERDRLRLKLRHVIKAAVRVDARKDRFPRTWLFHHRWGKGDGARTGRGEDIEFLTIGGRTTAWVPSAQR